MVATIDATTALMVESFNDTNLTVQSRGFQTFFSRNNPIPTFVDNSKSFNYDIKRGPKLISQLLSRKDAMRSLGSNSKVHTGETYENVSYVFPNMTETASADWNDTLDRSFGEQPYGDLERLQRMQMKLVENANEGMGMIAGRFEKMAVESLTTGIVTLDDTAGSAYNFGRSASNTFAATAFWTVTTHNPNTDIDLLDREIRQQGKTSADFVVMGEDAWVAYQNNTIIKETADIRNYHFLNLGDLGSQFALRPNVAWMIEAGFVLQGECRTPKGKKFPIFTYPEQYQDSSLVWQDYMPSKSVFMGDSTARMDRYFGPRLTMPASESENRLWMEKLGIAFSGVTEMPEGTAGILDPRMFNWDFTVPTGAQTGVYLRSSTNPLYIPTHIDAFGLITATVA